VALEPTSTL